ncbi:MAG: G8 domain-containing protein, partial [Planctomycetes bacterium]|nr:G8 domain-containing protein [Planctomycetota bacterium]
MLDLCLPFLLALTGAQASPVAVATSPCPRLLAGTARWSDPTTWPGGAVPSVGECVVIPAGKTVWLDVTPPPLGGLSIDGELIFACTDLELRADRIAVAGKLEVGSEQHPFHRRATLTLTDDFACGAEHQALTVDDGGVLRLIGEARPWSWMQLEQHAAPGSSQLVLERPSGWRAGDRVVVASSDFDAHQAEARTVTVASGAVLLLDQPLVHQHFGEHVGRNVDGIGVDERTEVGLLTRSIVVRGTPVADAQGRVHGGWVAARRTTATPRVEIAWTAFEDLGVEGLEDR